MENKENRDTFKMTYSAEQQEEIRQIREKYVPKAPDKMEQLRALDAGAGKKAAKVSLTVGVLGALIMGIGMSLAMSDFGALLEEWALLVGIVVGLLGIGLVVAAYPLYQRTLKKERDKIAPEILRLTDELMQ